MQHRYRDPERFGTAKSTAKTILGISAAYVVAAAIIVALIIGGTIFAIWYNNHLAVPLANSQRQVITCSIQYLTTQKSNIENHLDAIANENTEIADTHDYTSAQIDQFKAQRTQNARDIYNVLDQSQCSKAQIEADLGQELVDFYKQFPSKP